MKTVHDIIIRCSNSLDRVCRWGAVACLAAMLIIVSTQVVARYVFSQPPPWTEELTRFAMVWGGMLGAVVAFKAKFDPALFSVSPTRSRIIVTAAAIISASAVAVFVLPVLYFSFFGADWDFASGFVARQAGRTADTLGMSMVWVAAAVPFAMATIVVHLLARLAGDESGEDLKAFSQ
ncbi:MAG: TRAP transporter small permease subunit [Rhodospirillaceae bacterium]|nr:TRAP transporter small permease subunit [Rhodospirillaceae bacterium]